MTRVDSGGVKGTITKHLLIGVVKMLVLILSL